MTSAFQFSQVKDFGDLTLRYNFEVIKLYISFHCITNADAGKQVPQTFQVTDFTQSLLLVISLVKYLESHLGNLALMN